MKQFSTGVPQELLKHSIPDYNSQYYNNRPVKMNQNYTYFSCEIGKNIYFLVCHRILGISLCVPWDEKGGKLLGAILPVSGTVASLTDKSPTARAEWKGFGAMSH